MTNHNARADIYSYAQFFKSKTWLLLKILLILYTYISSSSVSKGVNADDNLSHTFWDVWWYINKMIYFSSSPLKIYVRSTFKTAQWCILEEKRAGVK